MYVIPRQAVPDCQFAKGMGKKRAVLLRCLAELADPLQLLGVVVVLLQRPTANGSVVRTLSAKARNRNQEENRVYATEFGSDGHDGARNRWDIHRRFHIVP